eukprot:m.35659 g.35659  ORF g.35659 m.35659 type:complete len:157 (-) comp12792_c0_seq1:117-587(-)
MEDIFGFDDAVVPEAVLKAARKVKVTPDKAKAKKAVRRAKAPTARGKIAARKSNRDMVAAETSTPVSTPVGKENSGRKMKALESPVSTLSDTSVELSQAASPVVWHQKVKEKKSDRSDDPELQKMKAEWLQKMNAEFAEVDEHALSEEPVSDSERR